MRIVGLEPETYMLIEPLLRDNFRLPTLYARIEIAAAGMHGTSPKQAFDIENLDRFLGDLIQFEMTRAGIVRLNSMSIREFTLAIQTIDRAGHVMVRSALKRFSPVNYRLIPSRMFLRFEIDPTSLPAVISEVRDLLDFQAPE